MSICKLFSSSAVGGAVAICNKLILFSGDRGSFTWPLLPLDRCSDPEIRRVMFFVVVFPKSNHEKLIQFVIASNLSPACVTACQQINASVRNVSQPTICNYCIHCESRQWTHKDWPGLCYRCAYANRLQIQVTFSSQEQTTTLLNFKMSFEDYFQLPK